MFKKVIISGICPESQKLQHVEAKLERLDLCGSTADEYEIIKFSCAYAEMHGCASTDDTMRGCPLYRKAGTGRA